MSATLLLALVLQAAGIMLLRHRLGRAWLRRPVTLLYLASVIYGGASAVLLSFPSVSAWDTFRDGTVPRFTDDAALLLSVATLALVIACLFTQPQAAQVLATPEDRKRAAAALDWRLLAAASLPLAWLTYSGRGYNGAAGLGPSASLASELAVTSFTIAVPITAFAVLLRVGPSWFLPVLAAQSGLLTLAGERTPVLAAALALAGMLAFAGIRPTARTLAAAGVLAAVAVLAITWARAAQGRYSAASGLSVRAEAAASGVTSLGATVQPGSPSLTAQAAGRLDGDAFTAAILQAEQMGQPRLSPAYVPESLLEAVPSALWPSKLTHAAALSPVTLETGDFGLQNVNFLPTLPGLYAGFLSPPWLIAFMAVLGTGFGWAERWLLRKVTPARLVMLAGAVTAAVQYEAGLPTMLVTLRSAVVIAVAVWAIEAVRGRKRVPVPDLAASPRSSPWPSNTASPTGARKGPWAIALRGTRAPGGRPQVLRRSLAPRLPGSS